MTETEEQKPIIESGVIVNPDGSRETEKKKLRLIQIPKINFEKDTEVNTRIEDDTEFQIKEIFDLFCDGEHADPNEIVEGLRSVDYNRKNPEVFRVIEDFANQFDKGKKVTFPMFMNYLNERLGEINTWNACGKVFNDITDKDLADREGKSEITEQSLHDVLDKLGEKLSLDDVKYIMNFVADGKDPNIEQHEFYYLMTKRPIEYNALAGITKSFKS